MLSAVLQYSGSAAAIRHRPLRSCALLRAGEGNGQASDREAGTQIPSFLGCPDWTSRVKSKVSESVNCVTRSQTGAAAKSGWSQESVATRHKPRGTPSFVEVFAPVRRGTPHRCRPSFCGANIGQAPLAGQREINVHSRIRSLRRRKKQPFHLSAFVFSCGILDCCHDGDVCEPSVPQAATLRRGTRGFGKYLCLLR